jgi:hypothetical protein
MRIPENAPGGSNYKMRIEIKKTVKLNTNWRYSDDSNNKSGVTCIFTLLKFLGNPLCNNRLWTKRGENKHENPKILAGLNGRISLDLPHGRAVPACLPFIGHAMPGATLGVAPTKINRKSKIENGYTPSSQWAERIAKSAISTWQS